MASSASGTVTATDLTQRIGITNEAALAYVREPDPRLDRLSARVREELITEIPAVTAGALLGTAALARHFVASAATGRYRDLFGLWELFSADPHARRPVPAARHAADARVAATIASIVCAANVYSTTGRPALSTVTRLPSAALSHASTRIICSRGNAFISAACGSPKPVRFFAVVNGKYMQVSRT